MDVRLVMKDGRLHPADHLAAEDLRGLKNGETVRAQITRPRNAGHHRKFFALMKVVFDNQSRYPTLKHLVDAIKLAIGHCDERKVDGKDIVVLRSISFAKLDQSGFEQFYDRVLDLVLTKILPHVARSDIEARVLDIINGPSARAA